VNSFITVIPARVGSRGLPRKNILSLVGKPLIFHYILDAQEAKLVDRNYVITDDSEIAQVLILFFRT